MHRITPCLVATMVAMIGAAPALAADPNLDIAGFKIGMSADEAMAALKAIRPPLTIIRPAHRVAGFPGPLQPYANASLMATATTGGQTINLLFTMPPNQEVLWGVQRNTNYPASNRPSTEATLAALRQKYGPENVPPNLVQNANLAWVFDAQGTPLAPAEAKRAYIHCMTPLQLHFGSDDISSFNDLSTGVRKDTADCNSIILITASVQSTQLPSGTWVVFGMIVSINDGPIYGAAIGPTRAQAVQAAKARDAKEKTEVKNLGAPTL